MTDVIDLKTRLPRAVIEQSEAAAQEMLELEKSSLAEAQQEMLTQIGKLLESGKLEGFVIIGRNPATGQFYSDISFPLEGMRGDVAAAYAVQLELLKTEFTDIAAMAPAMLIDGSTITSDEPEYCDD